MGKQCNVLAPKHVTRWLLTVNEHSREPKEQQLEGCNPVNSVHQKRWKD
jgi:hypothetical protein